MSGHYGLVTIFDQMLGFSAYGVHCSAMIPQSLSYFYLCAQELETGTSLWFGREFRGIATSGCIDWRGDVEGSGLSYLLTCKRSVGHIVG